MAYDEKTAARVRHILSGQREVVEKRMLVETNGVTVNHRHLVFKEDIVCSMKFHGPETGTTVLTFDHDQQLLYGVRAGDPPSPAPASIRGVRTC
jgi:hypothetical protein